jgi:hypothetical protein
MRILVDPEAEDFTRMRGIRGLADGRADEGPVDRWDGYLGSEARLSLRTTILVVVVVVVVDSDLQTI